MKLLRNKTHSFSLVLLFAIVFSVFFLSSSTHAVSITKVLDKKVGNYTGNTNWHSQGATMSKDYYIWTDWKKAYGPTHIVMCKRSDTKSCWRSPKSYDYDHASTLYHKWGTDYFFVKAGKLIKGCWSISKKKEVSKSNCNSFVSDLKLGTSITYTHETAQGYTSYGKYVLRSYGNRPGKNWISLFPRDSVLKNKPQILKDVNLPGTINEVEDVMVDGDTGEVYFSSIQYVGGLKHVQFFKVAKSTFSKWIKPGEEGSGGGGGGTSTDSGDGGGSSSLTGETGEKPGTYVYPSIFDRNVFTIFFGNFADDGKGCGVYMIMNLIITLLAYAIGISAIIGIAISGIMYLTAKGNVAQTTKAKRRISDIVIGVIAYALLYSILNFIIPGGNWSSNRTCGALVPVEVTQPNNQNQSGGGSSGGNSSENNENPNTGTTSAGRNLLTAAEYYATLLAGNNMKYCNNGGSSIWPTLRQKGCLNCAHYVSLAAQKAGLVKAGKNFYIGGAKLYGKKNFYTSKVKITQDIDKSISYLYKHKKLFPGDIVGSQKGTPHTMIFKGYKNGKYYFYSVNSVYHGVSAKTHSFKKSWITNKTYNGSWKIGVIVHPK